MDYMVMEAVALKVQKEDDEKRKEAERHAKAKNAKAQLLEHVKNT